MSKDNKRAKKPLSDEELLSKVEGAVCRGVGLYDTKISKERERVIKYKNLQLPIRQSEGRSSYVASDVYDSCSAMKAMSGPGQDDIDVIDVAAKTSAVSSASLNCAFAWIHTPSGTWPSLTLVMASASASAARSRSV